MKYNLNIGIAIMTRLIKKWPDSPVSILLLTDSTSEVYTGNSPSPTEGVNVNLYRASDNLVESQSKYLEDWYLVPSGVHPEEIERCKNVLHHLDFTGYCFQERKTIPGKLSNLMVTSNDVIVDRELWKPISLNQLKSAVLSTTTLEQVL